MKIILIYFTNYKNNQKFFTKISTFLIILNININITEKNVGVAQFISNSQENNKINIIFKMNKFNYCIFFCLLLLVKLTFINIYY